MLALLDSVATTSQALRALAPEDAPVIDFETFSECDLKACGAEVYAQHPTTEILCMSWRFDDMSEALIWVPGREPFPQRVIDHINAGGAIEAHNAGFERAIWRHICVPKLGLPWPKKWKDTMAVCAYRALPLKLKDVGDAIDLAVKKDRRGSYLIQRLCKPVKKTKKYPDGRCRDPDLLEELYSYCCDDTNSEWELGKRIGDLPGPEYRLWVLDQRINDRGVATDTALVEAAIGIVEQVADKLNAKLRRLTNEKVQTATQVKVLGEWLSQEGCPLPNLQATTVERTLKKVKNLPAHVREVLEIRQTLGRASIKKLYKYRDCTGADGRMRGLLQYHGASTGRWAGRLLQPQNFPRGDEDILAPAIMKEQIKANVGYGMEALTDAILFGDPDYLEMLYGDPIEAISSALRGMMVAGDGKTFYVADFAAIEARVTAWLYHEQWKLDAFAEVDAGKGYQGSDDMYCAAAAQIYGHAVRKKEHPEKRQDGKKAELAFGYQGGVGAWRKFDTREEDDKGYKTDGEINDIKNAWRKGHPRIVAGWFAQEAAAKQAVLTGKPTRCTYVIWETVTDDVGHWLTCRLPNGRRLWYYEPQLEAYEGKYGTEYVLSYMGRDNDKGGKWGRIDTYGGALTENIVQAISRDLMVEAMIRVEKAGYPIILTVHDEIISETDSGFGSLEEFSRLMKEIPDWATGLPINVDGWTGPRYLKK